MAKRKRVKPAPRAFRRGWYRLWSVAPAFLRHEGGAAAARLIEDQWPRWVPKGGRRPRLIVALVVLGERRGLAIKASGGWRWFRTRAERAAFCAWAASHVARRRDLFVWIRVIGDAAFGPTVKPSALWRKQLQELKASAATTAKRGRS
jgi:hypothetical protein